MSISLAEVLEYSGYKVTDTKEDAIWLLSKRTEFEELVERAQALVEAEEEKENIEIEQTYRETFPKEDENESN